MIRTERTNALTKTGAVFGVVLGLAAAPSAAQDSADEILLPGVIRDFWSGHTDFGKGTTHDYGHVAGNVHLQLSAHGNPVFTGAGYHVDSEWRDRESDKIAPHLYSTAGSGSVKVVASPSISDSPTLDTFNSALGPYGGSNVGAAPSFQNGATMPELTAPIGLPPIVSLYELQADQLDALDENMHCVSFIVGERARLLIRGQVTLQCDGVFRIENRAQIQMEGPDASLTVYVMDEAVLENEILINTVQARPGQFVIKNMGSKEIVIENGAHVYAKVISPEAPIHLENTGNFYGQFTGLTAIIENTSGFHIDDTAAADACGNTLDDVFGFVGADSLADVESADSFEHWFTDVLGENLSMGHTLRLIRNPEGVYEYLDNAFFPIDDRLFGNEFREHNTNFTFEANFGFVYDACSEQFFELYGKDDIYLYVDDQLVIDLGGFMSGQDQTIKLDRLGLTNGEFYQAKLFYANRNQKLSKLNFRTNVPLLVPTVNPVVSAGFD